MACFHVQYLKLVSAYACEQSLEVLNLVLMALLSYGEPFTT